MDDLTLTGFVVLAEGLETFRLRPVAADRKTLPAGNMSFTKTNLVGWMSGGYTQKGWCLGGSLRINTSNLCYVNICLMMADRSKTC